MSLRPSLAGAVPASTAMVARAAFPQGNLYMRLRDTLGTVFTDQQFAALFPSHGQPVEALWRTGWRWPAPGITGHHRGVATRNQEAALASVC